MLKNSGLIILSHLLNSLLKFRWSSIKKEKKRVGISYFLSIPPHLEMYIIPTTQMIVTINTRTIDTTAPVGSVNPSSLQKGVSLSRPTITSFHSSAITNPNAAAIAVAIFIFTSFRLTILYHKD